MEAKSKSKQREETKGSYGDASPSPALTIASDVITRVFSQLDLVDLLNCSLVCKQWCIDSEELREVRKQTARAEVVDKIKKFQHYFSQARDSRPDMRAFLSILATSPKEDRIGSVLGVRVGDSFQYRVELNLLGLHKNLQGGVSYKMLGDILQIPSIATSVVSMQQVNDKMKPSYDVLIYAGAEENQALLRTMRDKIEVRVIYGHVVKKRDGKPAIIYTYCGLYYVTGYEKVDLTEEKEGSIRYMFKFERINQGEKIVPRMVCEIAGGSCSKDN